MRAAVAGIGRESEIRAGPAVRPRFGATCAKPEVVLC
jgi:hypothetical protein